VRLLQQDRFTSFQIAERVKRLAWPVLDCRSQEMGSDELMGLTLPLTIPIHNHMASNLCRVLLIWKTSHFAWKERHVIDGVEREVIVHARAPRRSARSAGIIPGSMLRRASSSLAKETPNLNSASHGAGRYDRKAETKSFNWKDANASWSAGRTLISRWTKLPMVYIRKSPLWPHRRPGHIPASSIQAGEMAPHGERPERWICSL